jgi:S-adenosylmethionine synthetase
MSSPESLTTMPTEQLAIELAELKLKEQEPYLSEERKVEIRHKIGHYSFELQERVKTNEVS